MGRISLVVAFFLPLHVLGSPIIQSTTVDGTTRTFSLEVLVERSQLPSSLEYIYPLVVESFEVGDDGLPMNTGDIITDRISAWEDRGPIILSDGFTNQALLENQSRYLATENAKSAEFRFYKHGDERSSPVMWMDELSFGETGKVFLSFWVNYRWPYATPSQAYQFKIFALASYLSENADYNYPKLPIFNWVYPGGGRPYTQTYTRLQIDDNGSRTFYLPNDSMPIATEGWFHFVFLVDEGSLDTADGSLIIRLSDLDGMPYKEISRRNEVQFSSSLAPADKRHFGAFKLAWYTHVFDDVDFDISLLFDEIVVQNSWVSVWLGDADRYSDCTLLEQQVIKSAEYDTTKGTLHASTSFQLGQLERSLPIYAYFMDAHGIVNEVGYELSVSGRRPSPVENLIVEPKN